MDPEQPVLRQYFVRKRKKPKGDEIVEGVADLETIMEGTPRSCQSRRVSSVSSTPQSSWKVSNDAYHWVGRSLALRRCSMVVGMAIPVVRHYDIAAQQKSMKHEDEGVTSGKRQRKQNRKCMDPKKEEQYRKEEEALKKEFAEIDAFDLVEEFPSPEKKIKKLTGSNTTPADDHPKHTEIGKQLVCSSNANATSLTTPDNIRNEKEDRVKDYECLSSLGDKTGPMWSTDAGSKHKQCRSVRKLLTPESNRFTWAEDGPEQEKSNAETAESNQSSVQATPESSAGGKMKVCSSKEVIDPTQETSQAVQNPSHPSWLEARTPEDPVLQQEEASFTIHEKPCSLNPCQHMSPHLQTAGDKGIPCNRFEASATPKRNLEPITNVVGSSLQSPGYASAAGIAEKEEEQSVISSQDKIVAGSRSSLMGLKPMQMISDTACLDSCPRRGLLVTPTGSHLSSIAQTPLERLLGVCKQEITWDAIPSMDAALENYIDLENVTKVGEGAYGEAFMSRNIIVKIVPIEGENEVNGSPQIRADEVLGEVIIGKMLSNLRQSPGNQNSTSGFAQTHSTRVCKGKYSPALVSEWDRWNKASTSENDSVESFGEDQLYTVFVLDFGGQDLENFNVTCFNEVKSILAQVVLALSIGEEALQFEHRDLHLGNVLINRRDTDAQVSVFRGQRVELSNCGVEVVLIDFTLSRMSPERGQVVYYDLSQDPDIFKGPKWNQQAEVYRKMKSVVGNKWDGYSPKTNALWICFLVDSFLSRKGTKLDRGQRGMLKDFRQKARMAESSSHLLFDEFFADILDIRS